MNGTDRLTGKRLSGLAHLRQSVADILNTPRGSRVLRRDYGSDVPDLVDNPPGDLTRLRIIAASASALARWEPRIGVTGIDVFWPAQHACELSISGVYKQTGRPVKLEKITVNGI
ncbi:GPW/gp25 family protein [Mixta calida]|uniref:GPW/gp25 family protein n=1 Tax=Mixta calida TaxID=665913 RepID=UPI0034D4D61D